MADCPVLDLSIQSGHTRSVASKKPHAPYPGASLTGLLKGHSSDQNQRDDEGTAARFFKQFKEDK